MTVAFDQYQKTKIKQMQTKLASTYKTIFYYMGWDNEKVNIIPFSLIEDKQIDTETTLETN